MASVRDRKLYLGPRLRMLRRELGLNQTQMAEELNVSPSYLNHLERNQRPLTAQMLLRLADTYDLDIRGFVAGAKEAAASDLTEILADDLVRDLEVSRHEALEIAENYPNSAEVIKRLHRALTDFRQLRGRAETDSLSDGSVASPIAWAREWLEGRENHFATLDDTAQQLASEFGSSSAFVQTAIVARLLDRHGVSVRVVPQDVVIGAARHYDFHRRRLMLSERLSAASRLFGIAVQLAQLELTDQISTVLAEASAPDPETRGLLQQMLVNHAAAAILMPYARFHGDAEETGYDLDVLADRFGTSIEQVAHRLTTLANPAMRGAPLFLLKLDSAGNVMKRYVGGSAPFARFGGGCPRWRVHQAPRHMGHTVVDLVETPDGKRYLTWARAVRAYPQHEPALLILGCDAEYAKRIRYGVRDGATVATPIGSACHLCERSLCHERSLPPLTRPLATSQLTRPLGRYAFRPI